MKDIIDIILSYDFNGKLSHLYQKYTICDIINTILFLLDEDSKDIMSNGNNTFIISLTFALDLYIFSDLTNEQKEDYIQSLYKLSFFEKIEKYLYHKKLTIRLNTISFFGRFSREENVKYLEKAFENCMAKNPIEASRCLLEIQWLKSKKTKKYIKTLKDSNEIINLLTLCLFYNSLGYESKERELLLKKYNSLFNCNVDDFNGFFDIYFIVMNNMINVNNINDLNPEEYVKSILFYNKNLEHITDGVREDFQGTYEKIYRNIIAMEETQELSDTEHSSGGFGSTGV
jgi:hypothetical protein